MCLYRYFADVTALAEWADFRHRHAWRWRYHNLVNAAVLNALGPRGVVVNIARGA